MSVKTNREIKGVLILIIVSILISCNSERGANKDKSEDNYCVAAYVWPAHHNEEMVQEKLWGKGIGEWEIIQQADTRFKGHYQPRVPLWGYEMDDDPVAWEKKIKAATDHGVNTFIFDWYWYEGKPFLENTLNNGFLKAGNNHEMNFYIMWANHNVKGKWWSPYKYNSDTLLFQGKVDWDNFKIIVDRVINSYFRQPNYFTIDNEPVFSIFSLHEFIKSFPGIEDARKALDYFREKVKEAGFPGLHLQVIGWGRKGRPYLFGSEVCKELESINEIVSSFNINSMTTYNWLGAGLEEDYIIMGEKAMSLREKWDSLLTIPYFPVVATGYDDTSRYLEKGIESVVHIHNTPSSFAAYLQKAREYVRLHPDQPKIIIINAWNEWTEGSYLEPDMRWGYGYLEAVKEVMSGKYDSYSKE